MVRCRFLSRRKSINPRRTKRPSAPPEKRSSALRIVHAGGLVERYYMAVPASKIMEKYPSFILARPEVFQQPWNSEVQPDEILIPGQKFFVVPRRTVMNLRRTIKKRTTENLTGYAAIPESSRETSFRSAGSGESTESDGGESGSFSAMEAKYTCDSSSSAAETSDEESPGTSSGGPVLGERRRARNITWKPSLFAINES